MSPQFLSVFSVFAITLASSPALAFEATITRVSPIEGHPAGSVARIELAPVEGIPVAPPRAPATAYVPEERAPARVPIPTSNRAALSWCPSDVL